jgi:hypothetical protein
LFSTLAPLAPQLEEFVARFRRGAFNLGGTHRIGFDPGNGLDVDMIDPDDVELTVLHEKLARQVVRDGGANETDLVSTTKLAARAAMHDFVRLVERHANLEECDVAVVACVQIHGQYHDMGRAEEIQYDTEFIALQEAVAWVGGEKKVVSKVDGLNQLEVQAIII